MRPRFRLRTLLILTALAAAACWWFARPSMLARQFLRTFEAGDYALVDRLIGKPERAVQTKLDEARELGLFTVTRCEPVPPTIADWLAGRRVILFRIWYRANLIGNGITIRLITHEVVATPFGLALHPGKPQPEGT